MKEYDLTRRKPSDIAKALRSRIRQLSSARELLALEPVPAELIMPVEVAIEHIKFLEADLNIELTAFEYRNGLKSQTPHKGLR